MSLSPMSIDMSWLMIVGAFLQESSPATGQCWLLGAMSGKAQGYPLCYPFHMGGRSSCGATRSGHIAQMVEDYEVFTCHVFGSNERLIL